MPKATKPSFNLRDPTLPPPKRKRSQLSKLTYKAQEAPWRQTSISSQAYKKFGIKAKRHQVKAPLISSTRSFRDVADMDAKETLDSVTQEQGVISPTLKAIAVPSFDDHNDEDEAPPREIDEFLDLRSPDEPHRCPKKEDQTCILPPQSTVFTKQREIAELRVKKMRKQSLTVKKRAYEDVIDIPT